MKVYVVERINYVMTPNSYTTYGSSTIVFNTLYYNYNYYFINIEDVEKVFNNKEEADRYVDDRIIHNRSLGFPEIYFNIIEKELND